MSETPESSGRKRVYSVRAPRVDLEITPEIIEDSTRRDSSHCMIAEAVKAAVVGARYVSVDLQTIRFTDPDRPYRYTYLTPRLGQVALVNFDQGRMPEPFHIRLRGGAVTETEKRSEARKSRRTRQTERQTETTAVSAVAPLLKPRVPVRAALTTSAHGGGENGSRLERVGGRTPPRAALSSDKVKGSRRAFGIRALEQ